MRVLNERGFVVWRSAGDVSVGDTLLGVLGADADAKDQIDEREALLLGYLVGDGHYSAPYAVMFSQVDEQVSTEFNELMADLAPDVVPSTYAGRPGDTWFRGKALRDSLTERYGLEPVKAPEKVVPLVVRASGAAVQRAFLSALFECDGCVEDDTVTLTTASRQLAREVQCMLRGLGLVSVRAKSVPSYPDNVYWTVALGNASSARFVDEVGFRSDRRAVQTAGMRRGVRDAARHIPHLRDVARDLRDSVGGDREFDKIAGDLFRDFGPGHDELAATPERIVRLVRWAEERGVGDHALVTHLRQLAARPSTYERVVAVEAGGVQPTFDLVVPGTHSFVANGLAVAQHHSGAARRRQRPEAGRHRGVHRRGARPRPRLRAEARRRHRRALVSQPDTGEQALEIIDMLVRSGALDIIVIDSVAALVPRAEIEGEMGDSHVGLQARLMSQALRKMTGALSNTNTTAIFINQLREKIGVMFGCISYDTRVTLADGTQEKIGKIVNQRLDVEVLSYDPETGGGPGPSTNWFDNGRGRGVPAVHRGEVRRQRPDAVRRHREPPDPDPRRLDEAGELMAGDRVHGGRADPAERTSSGR